MSEKPLQEVVNEALAARHRLALREHDPRASFGFDAATGTYVSRELEPAHYRTTLEEDRAEVARLMGVAIRHVLGDPTQGVHCPVTESRLFPSIEKQPR